MSCTRGWSLRQKRVVPIAMEWVWFQVELGHLRGRYFDSGGTGSLCQCCFDLEPRRGPGVGNQMDDGLIADQRSCPPVLRDEGEHAVFDEVPFLRRLHDRLA